MLIAGQAYKVINVIFHYGTYIKKGHYTSREGTSWIEIDNAQVTKKQWPKGARDIYYFYKKLLLNTYIK